MIVEIHPVTVLQIPPHLTHRGKAKFLSELTNYLDSKRPRIVLDCSKIRRMDKEMITLLLACLEEAMKCNGNVKLAGLRPVAEAVVRYAGLHRIFEIFPTASEAEQSYQKQASRLLVKSSELVDTNAGSVLSQKELRPALG